MFRRLAFILAVLGGALGASGCAGGLTEFIVQQRNAQGDAALERGNLTDAQLAYRLAVQVDPQDSHARAGLAAVQLKIAAQLFTKSKLEDALAALAVAAKYDPDSVRLAELRSEIEEARVKREIVVSNYPTYKETGLALRRSYTQLRTQTGTIVAALQRFDYTYDSDQLTAAIRSAYELNADVNRLTTRLVSYRQLVESGAPERAADQPLAPAASLLPLP